MRATQIQEPKLSSMLERLIYFTNWHRARRGIAVCLRLQQRFRKADASKSQGDKGTASYKPVDVQERRHAELEIIMMV